MGTSSSSRVSHTIISLISVYNYTCPIRCPRGSCSPWEQRNTCSARHTGVVGCRTASDGLDERGRHAVGSFFRPLARLHHQRLLTHQHRHLVYEFKFVTLSRMCCTTCCVLDSVRPTGAGCGRRQALRHAQLQQRAWIRVASSQRDDRRRNAATQPRRVVPCNE